MIVFKKYPLIYIKFRGQNYKKSEEEGLRPARESYCIPPNNIKIYMLNLSSFKYCPTK
jgi:hypothetical protein